MQEKLKQAIVKAGKSLWKAFPLIFGTILLVSLIITLIPKTFYIQVFRGDAILDPFVGSLIGSISAGTPITSYIIGGELLKQGVSLIAITAFLVAWVTVGMIQLPAESMILGKKFAILRNLISFVFAMVVAIITVLIFNILK